MLLKRAGREFYEFLATAYYNTGELVPPAVWEASFDHGETWHAAQVVTHVAPDLPAGEFSAWLVAGPAFVPPEDDEEEAFVIARNLVPQIRLIDDPEHIIRDADSIQLY